MPFAEAAKRETPALINFRKKEAMEAQREMIMPPLIERPPSWFKANRKLVEAGLFLLLVVVFLGIWQSERESRIRAEANEQAQKHISEAQAVVIKDAKEAIKQRDENTAEQVREFQHALAIAKTPSQAAAQIPKSVDLPDKPKQAEVDAPSAGVKKGDLIFSEQNIMPLYARLNQCQQNEVLLSTCRADVKDKDTQIAATEKQRDAEKSRGDGWEKTAKGGSKFRRTLSALKYIGIGVGIGIGISTRR